MTEQTANPHPPMVKAEHVSKSFGSLQVLKDINLDVDYRQVVCLIGPSGSGKSTFLRWVNHLETIDGGHLYVDGELIGYRRKNGTLYALSENEIAQERRDIGMAFSTSTSSRT